MGKAERTKQLIIEKASTIFNRKGVAGTSVDDVLDAAKVAKGCLYNHFENKEALANETIDYLLKKITDRTAAVMSTQNTSKGKIFAYLDFNKDPINSFIDGGCPIFNMAVESDNTDPAIKEKVKKILISGQKMFSDILKAGIDNGEFTTELDPKEYAFKMFTSLEGATVVCRVLGTNKPIVGLIESLKKELTSYEK